MLEEVHHLELICMLVFLRSILKCLRLLSPRRFRLDYLVPTAALIKQMLRRDLFANVPLA